MTNQGVLVYSETAEQKATIITRQVMTVARKLSNDLGQPLMAFVMGKAAAQEIVSLGADKVYVMETQANAEANPDFCAAVLADLAKQVTPAVVLLGQTDIGRDTAPRLAARLGGTVVTDCTALAVDAGTKQLLKTKPVYGGKAMAVWTSSEATTQVVTLRRGSAPSATPDTSRKGEITALNVAVDAAKLKIKLIETVKEEVKGVKIDDAKVVVGGGGGIGGPDGFGLLRDLAQALGGGAIGTTTIPTDEGWMPTSGLIGQSGHIISPELYISVGISGAPQHTAGVQAAKVIVAINRDPEAAIFKMANFGVVGDFKKVLPALTERCKTLVKSGA